MEARNRSIWFHIYQPQIFKKTRAVSLCGLKSSLLVTCGLTSPQRDFYFQTRSTMIIISTADVTEKAARENLTTVKVRSNWDVSPVWKPKREHRFGFPTDRNVFKENPLPNLVFQDKKDREIVCESLIMLCYNKILDSIFSSTCFLSISTAFVFLLRTDSLHTSLI